MKLHIYSLKGIVYEGEIKSINLKTMAGDITVLDNHLPLVSVLKSGSIKIVDIEDKTLNFPIENGFLEVKPGNLASILVS